jgi:hypothetical protein
MLNVWERRGINRGQWWESQKERDYQDNLYVGGSIILKWSFRE